MSSESSSDKKPHKIKPIGADGHRGRMLERFLSTDPRAFPLRDLIEILLFYSIRIRDTRDSAVLLCQKYKNTPSSLLTAPQKELSGTDGIGATSAMLINIIGSIILRLHDREREAQQFRAPVTDIREVFEPLRQRITKESVCIAIIDGGNRLAYADILTIEKLTCSGDEVYQMASLAYKYHCSNIVLARLTKERASYPTSDDIKASRHIEEILRTMGMILGEYYVISAEECIAVKELYL